MAKKTGAWQAPKDLTVTKRLADGYWTDKSQDREQTAAPELRTETPFESGWPTGKHYRIQRMHMDWDGDLGGISDRPLPRTDGKGRFAARTDNSPKNEHQSQSNRSGRIRRNTYGQTGKTG